MDLNTGVFTAPKEGFYHFHFSGKSPNVYHIYLRLNGENIGFAHSHTNSDYASIHSTLQLKKGDRVDLWLLVGTLYDDYANQAHFTGWLDQEELLL